MKHFLLALLLVSSLAVADPIYVNTDENGAIFLTDEPCSQKDIVAHLPADTVMQTSRWYAQYTTEGQKKSGVEQVEGCYLIEASYVFWINEHGATGEALLSEFSKLKAEGI